MFDNFFDEHVNFIKSLILAASIGIFWLIYLSEKYDWQEKIKNNISLTLKIFFTLAAFAFFNFGFLHYKGGFFQGHEMFNSYMHAKYFNQVGYRNLYSASMVADSENRKFFRDENTVRDQNNFELIPREKVYETQHEWRGNFSDHKWQEFKNDLEFFQLKEKPKQWLGRDISLFWWSWENILNDKGFVESPARISYTSIIAKIIPIDTYIGAHLLAFSDVILLALMFVLLKKTFSLNTAMLSLIMLFCGNSFYFSWAGNSLLKMDWLFFIVASICFMKTCNTLKSGLFLGFATAVKIFPAVLFLPVIIKFAWNYFALKKFDEKQIKFFAGFFGGLVGLIIFSFVMLANPLNAWADYFTKLSYLAEQMQTWKWGFNDLFTWQGEVYNNLAENWRVEKAELISSLLPGIIILKILFCLALAKFVINKETSYWQALAVSSSLFFIFFQLNKTEYIFLMLPCIFLFAEFKNVERIKAATALFTANIFIYIMQTFQQSELLLKFVFAFMLLGIFVYIIARDYFVYLVQKK